MDFFARLYIPDLDNAKSGSAEKFPVRTECNALNTTGPPRNRAYLFTGVNLPEFNLSIFTAGGQEFAIRRAKGDRLNALAMSRISTDLFARVTIPKDDCTVLASADQKPSIWAKRDRIDRVR